ncbi:GIY-YIG nuclease family protein [Photobacterium sp. 1_MG-2023]|uniref:GIY-YIG nuclease family protein n=1 Tax=Photobacterium sp. 1_MG-2023 TaxID=3062646 RepID=UPI0026E1CDE6|nr:GIY-YIG nuclease family protein [Photobacterium sp. 1_MG-2023]MDO6706716.1 GIY-YIG nuclease family protein [Photobacterium sp. 1_MG-2023]
MNLRDPVPIWSVYLIRTRCNRLYCGVTTDVNRRYSEHQTGKKGARFLKGKGPLTLAWSAGVGDKRKAMQLEYKIKQLTKPVKEALAANQVDLAELFPAYFE